MHQLAAEFEEENDPATVALFEELRAWRAGVAKERSKPAYTVLADAETFGGEQVATTAAANHGLNARNAVPPMRRIISISCGAYATDDSASEAKIGSAIFFGSSCPSSSSLVSGSPMRMRLAIGVSSAGPRLSSVTARHYARAVRRAMRPAARHPARIAASPTPPCCSSP